MHSSPTFYFCTQLGNIVSDQRISKNPRNSQRMINRITNRPPQSLDSFESMWQGFDSLSCFLGGRPRGAPIIKRGALERAESAQKRCEAQGRDQVLQNHQGDERQTSQFFGGGPLPQVVEGPRAWSSSRRVGASKPERNSASRPSAREAGGGLEAWGPRPPKAVGIAV
mgnify:CR=1 FL=1